MDASWRDVWPFLLRGVPWFPTLHFGYPIGSKPFLVRLELIAIKAAFLLGRPISVGHEVARSWGLQGIIIPNPYDDTLFHHPAPQALRDTDLLFVGRIECNKGIFVFSKHWLNSRRNSPDLYAALTYDPVWMRSN